MKKKIIVNEYNKQVEREINYIPFRYIVAIFLVVIETLAVIAVMTLLTIYIPHFYFAVVATQFGVAIAIINRKDNPDNKQPWLFFVMLIPIVGFMLYFMFYSRIDYRSLVHHFENGVWIYKHKVIDVIKQDFLNTQEKSIKFEIGILKENLFQRFVRAMVKVFSPLL